MKPYHLAIVCLYVSENYIDLDIFKKLKLKLLTYEIPKSFFRCDHLTKKPNGKISTDNVQAYLEKFR